METYTYNMKYAGAYPPIHRFCVDTRLKELILKDKIDGHFQCLYFIIYSKQERKGEAWDHLSCELHARHCLLWSIQLGISRHSLRLKDSWFLGSCARKEKKPKRNEQKYKKVICNNVTLAGMGETVYRDSHEHVYSSSLSQLAGHMPRGTKQASPKKAFIPFTVM